MRMRVLTLLGTWGEGEGVGVGVRVLGQR
jgi:hypothetical protein